MPWLHAAGKSDRQGFCGGWQRGLLVRSKTVWIHSVWHHMHLIPSHGKSFQIFGDFLGNREQDLGGIEGPFRHTLCAGAIDQAAMFGLFLNQRRVDFEQTWRSRRPGVLHPGKTPERVPLVHQGKRALALERGAKRAIGPKTLLFTE